MKKQTGVRLWTFIGWAAVLVAAALVPATAAASYQIAQVPPEPAQRPSVEALLARVFSTDAKDPYDLTAEFKGSLLLGFKGSRFAVTAAGAFEEWRPAGGDKHRKIAIQRLDVPTLLRPFSGLLRRVIEEQVQTQAEKPDAFYAHDIFILEERPGRRYVLVGVRRDLVDEILNRYGRSVDKTDPDLRRSIARWLYTSPSMRNSIMRPGPPYAFQTVVDELGLIYELTSFYNWGPVESTFAYTSVSGQLVWQQIAARFTYTSAASGQSALTQLTEFAKDLAGVDRIDGQLRISFANYCLNCRRP